MRTGAMFLIGSLAALLSSASLAASAQHEPSGPAGAPKLGTVSGVVRFDGKIPPTIKVTPDADLEVCIQHEIVLEDLLISKKTLGVKNVFVELLGAKQEKSKYDGKTVYLLDQKECLFIPHVLVVPPRAVIEFRNSDTVLHNVRTKSRINRSFNLAIPGNKSVKKKLLRPDKVKVTCDLHKWMSCWIIVAKNRFHTLTDAQGTFDIKGLPPGKYEVRFWHEKLGQGKARIEIKAGQDTKLEFRFKEPS